MLLKKEQGKKATEGFSSRIFNWQQNGAKRWQEFSKACRRDGFGTKASVMIAHEAAL